MFQNKVAKLILCVVLGNGVWQKVSAGPVLVDDFESYQDGQVVGNAPNSKPWRRFGAATADNIIVVSDSRWRISGKLTGIYSVTWPNIFGSVRYVFDAPRDLNGFISASVRMKSDRVDTSTFARLVVSNGRTTYISIDAQPISSTAQELVYEIGQNQMVRVEGADRYDVFIKLVRQIGFEFRSGSTRHSESIAIDDFRLIDQENQLPGKFPLVEKDSKGGSEQPATNQAANQPQAAAQATDSTATGSIPQSKPVDNARSVSTTTSSPWTPSANKTIQPRNAFPNRIMLTVYGLSCPLCANNVDKQLMQIKGVEKVQTDLFTGQVTVFVSSTQRPSRDQLSQAVALSGFTLIKIEGL